MKKKWSRYCFLLLLVWVSVRSNAQEPERFLLWPQGAPESNGLKGLEKSGGQGTVTSAHVAELFVYHPDPASAGNRVLVICPGGGYTHLAMGHEGEAFARWLNERGITAVVLKYRMPNHHYRIPAADAGRALQWVRSRAEEWNIENPEVGIAGFSAGGHLASTLATHFTLGKPQATDRLERFSSRPDFVLLFYPVISMTDALAHKGSREALLGKKPSPDLIARYSNEKQVTAQIPPVFLVHSDDDRTVSPLNSIAFYQALKKHKVPAVLYIFDKGGHGWGLRESFEYYPQWTRLLETWLEHTGKQLTPQRQ